MNYDSEVEAFERFCKVFPTSRALLLDTYDTIEGAKRAVSSRVKPTLVRLDSGDRYDLSKKVRRILDLADLRDTKIFVTGDLNEHVLESLTSRKAPIDFFGVGTELATSRDDPALSGIYKLVGVRRGGQATQRVKTSEGKRTIPGTKQIHRKYTQKGKIQTDILALENEEPPRGTVPLMIKVIQKGSITYTSPTLDVIQENAKREISTLPPKFLRLKGSVKPPVKLSRNLELLAKKLWTSSA
jgi:nicotinate phosphoribosyltransferase